MSRRTMKEREGSEAAGNVMCRANENVLVGVMARKYDGGRKRRGRRTGSRSG